MEMKIDIQNWLAASSGRNGSRERQPDWQGLLVQLTAARQARQSMEADSACRPLGGSGSFDPASASGVIGMGHDSRFVNPTDSANRNDGRAKDTYIVADGRRGDRGQR